MPKVVLLSDWNAVPTWKEIIGKALDPERGLPESWEPRLTEAKTLDQTEAIAFPTPFAWSEMMSAVIRQGLYNHLLFKLYEDLFLGLVLGHLQLEVADLKDFELGRVLAGTDDRYRYFGLLRGHPRQSDLQGKIFGATAPESLLWPSPRRTDAEWRKLKELITTDSRLNDGYRLLADLRDLMRRQKYWSADTIPWMKGLDRILKDHTGSDGAKYFQVHCHLTGPILASLGAGKSRPLYFPVYKEGFAADLLRALTGSFKQEEGVIAIYDDKNRKACEVRLPSVPTDGDLLLAGGGTLRLPDVAGRIKEFGSARVRLENDEKGDGLHSLLQPLEGALRREQPLYDALGNDPESIRQYPFFYPDVVRIPTIRLGQIVARDTEVSFSGQAYELAFDSDSSGLPLISELEAQTEANRSFILNFTQGGGTRRLVYIESYAGRRIGDLTALGWLLWAFFIGEATWQDDKLRDAELTPLLAETKSGRPFDLTSHAHERALADLDQYRRLATLQRFLRSYSERAKSPDASEVIRLFYEAASAFANSVWAEQPVMENGRASDQWQTVELSGLRVELARDKR